MKKILFASALSLGLLIGAAIETGGGTTAPKGSVLDIAETGGGTTAPKGSVLDIAATETGGGTTAPKGSVLDIA